MLEYELHESVIDKYLKNELPKNKKDIDLKVVAKEIIERLQKAIELENATGGHKNWKLPKRLDMSEIDIILRHILTMRKISLTDDTIGADSYILAVYNEDNDRGKEGIYSIDDNYINEKIYNLNPSLTISNVKDIKALIYTRIPTAKLTKDINLIPVENGIFDKKTKKLKDFDPKYVFLSKIPIKYNESAVNPIIKDEHDNTFWDVEQWMRDLTDDIEIQSLLWQILAAAIQPNHGWNKAIWLYAQTGNNGKGTYLELIRNLVGDGNYATLKVKDFSKEFSLEALIGTSCTLADENDVNDYIDSSANYKTAVTGDKLSINRKFKTPVEMNYKGLIIQCMNGFPKTRDKSNSFYRRLILVPFDKSFEGVEKPYIKYDYLARTEVLEYVLYKILHMEFHELKAPQISQDLLNEYKDFNDTTRQFWSEMRDEFVWDLLPNDFLYQLYVEWSKVNAPYGKIVNKKTFLNDLSILLEHDDEWQFKGNKTDWVKTLNKMDKPEYLIHFVKL